MESSASESTLHPDYAKNLPQWKRCDDAVNGQAAIKSGGETYLPMPDPLNQSKENKERYKQFKERAVYANYTGRTHAGLLGAAFRKPAEIDLPSRLEYTLTNFDGSGIGIEQVARRMVDYNLRFGRGGVLVDFPRVEAAMTLEQSQGVTARACLYSPKAIINWDVTTTENGDKQSLVVLAETYKKTDNIFDHSSGIQYRVLYLKDGVYTQYIARDDGTKTEEIQPRDASGALFTELPFVIFGAENNDIDCDKPPIADLADLNISHYQNSAELEESVHFLSQPTMIIGSSQSVDDFKAANPDGVRVGSRSGHFLGSDVFATLLQATANNLAVETMKRKEEQMIQIGARIIQAGGANETATGALIKAGTDNSVLSLVVSNVNAAILKAYGFMARFMGETGEINYEMNQDFFDREVSPQMIVAAMQLKDRGALATSDLIDYARVAGLIKAERTNDDIEGEAEIEDTMTNERPAAA